MEIGSTEYTPTPQRGAWPAVDCGAALHADPIEIAQQAAESASPISQIHLCQNWQLAAGGESV